MYNFREIGVGTLSRISQSWLLIASLEDTLKELQLTWAEKFKVWCQYDLEILPGLCWAVQQSDSSTVFSLVREMVRTVYWSPVLLCDSLRT